MFEFVGVATAPIERAVHTFAFSRERPLQTMPDPPTLPPRVNNPHLTGIPGEDALVGRLATAPRVEHGLIQRYLLLDTHDSSVDLLQVSVRVLRLVECQALPPPAKFYDVYLTEASK